MERLPTPDDWFQASDFTAEGRELTIEKILVREIGPSITKTCVYFKGEKKALVLNQANTKTIEHNIRIPVDNWEKWAGYKITLYATTVLFKDVETPCIRIKFLVNERAEKEV